MPGGGKTGKAKWRSLDVKDPDETLTTKGRKLRDLKQETNDIKEAEATMREFISDLFETRPTGVAYKRFVLASFSTHCTTRQGEVVPAEGALLEMSLFKGKYYHNIRSNTVNKPKENFGLADPLSVIG